MGGSFQKNFKKFVKGIRTAKKHLIPKLEPGVKQLLNDYGGKHDFAT